MEVVVLRVHNGSPILQKSSKFMQNQVGHTDCADKALSRESEVTVTSASIAIKHCENIGQLTT